MGAQQSQFPQERRWDVVYSAWEPSTDEAPHYVKCLRQLRNTSISTFVTKDCELTTAERCFQSFATKGDDPSKYSDTELLRIIRLCALTQLGCSTTLRAFAQMSLTILPTRPVISSMASPRGKFCVAQVVLSPLRVLAEPASYSAFGDDAPPSSSSSFSLSRGKSFLADVGDVGMDFSEVLKPSDSGVVFVNYLHIPSYEKFFEAAKTGSSVDGPDALKIVAEKIFRDNMPVETLSSICKAVTINGRTGIDPANLDTTSFSKLDFVRLCNVASFHTLNFCFDTASPTLLRLLCVTETEMDKAREIHALTLVDSEQPLPLPRTFGRQPSTNFDISLSPQAKTPASDEFGCSSLFVMKDAEKQHYHRVFEELCSQDQGRVSQEDFAHYFVAELGLPVHVVRYAFHLADIDGDCLLDDAEYLIAHHLLFCWAQGVKAPTTLPIELVPRGKRDVALVREIPMRSVKRIFISYRWQSGNAKGMAMLLRDTLMNQLKYSSVFLDIFDLTGSVVRLNPCLLGPTTSASHATKPAPSSPLPPSSHQHTRAHARGRTRASESTSPSATLWFPYGLLGATTAATTPMTLCASRWKPRWLLVSTSCPLSRAPSSTPGTRWGPFSLAPSLALQ
jgi:hypothetical protein